MNGEPSLSNSVEIRLGIIGKGASGKTVMLNAIRKIMFAITLEDGFEFGALSTFDTKDTIRSLSQAESKVRESLMQRTTTAADFRYGLFRAEKQLLTFVYHDAIGQLLSINELGKEKEDEHYKFVQTLADADVIWAYLPLNGDADNASFNTKEADILKSYLREVLKKREENSSVSIAIVLTKADRAAQLQEKYDAAKPRFTKLVEEAKKTFLNIIVYSERVANGAVFPVSAFGFGNAQKLEGATDSGMVNEQLEPWNVDTLLLWSLDCGLRQPGQPGRVRTKVQQQAVDKLQPAIAGAFDRLSLERPLLIVRGGRQ